MSDERDPHHPPGTSEVAEEGLSTIDRKSLRILQVNAVDQGGGAEGVAVGLHRGFLARGHQSLLGVGRIRQGGPGIFRIEQGRGPAWRLHSTLDHARKYRAARVARAFAEPATVVDALLGHEDFRFPGVHHLFDQQSVPNILQLHNLHGGYFDLRALPFLGRSVNTVATLHDAWMLTGHCAHPLDCGRWEIGCGACPYLDTYPALRRDGTAFNHRRKAALFEATSMSVVTPSRWLMDMVDRSILVPAATRTRVIPNGVDLHVFSPGDRREARRQLGVDEHCRLIVAASQGGQDNPFRDAETLIGALKRLGDGGLAVELVSLGEPRDSERHYASVTLSGRRHVPPGLVKTWLNAADVYVHVARADTFPSSILEALACGTPVVASAVGGIPEQVRSLGDRPHPTGMLVAPGDAAALALAIEHLLGSPDVRHQLGQNGVADARRRFGVELQVDAYAQLYAEILEPVLDAAT